MATLAKVRFETRNSLEESARTQLVELMNQHLADLTDLYSQTKQAHWNVRGIHFQALHELFDELAETILPFIDDVAERAAALGGYALGTTRMAAESSRLPEFPDDISEGQAVVEVLVERWAHYANALREEIDTADDLDDTATEDLMIEISREIDKGLWFLESHLN